jgi:hypothetical protein
MTRRLQRWRDKIGPCRGQLDDGWLNFFVVRPEEEETWES